MGTTKINLHLKAESGGVYSQTFELKYTHYEV